MRRLVRLILAALFIAWLLTGVKEIRPGQQAVVRRFGRVLDVQPRAGLWIGFPWGIDQVDRIAIKELRGVTVGYRPLEATDDTPQGQLLTGDRNLINIRIVVNWTVDPDALVAYVEQQDRVEGLIARAAETALTEWVGGRTVDEVMIRGKVTLPVELPAEVQKRLDVAGLGVKVHNVVVADLTPPDDVKEAFDRVAQAEVYSKRAEQEANEEVEKKKRASDSVIFNWNQEGQTYKTSRPNQARAEAAGFEARLRALRDNPLVLEAGRLAHLMQMVKRLVEAGNLQPLDPAIESPFPGMGKPEK